MALLRGSSFFICDQCNKEFNGKRSLLRHIWSIHKEGPIFTCDVCYKDFNTKYHLANHIGACHQDRIRVINCQLCVYGCGSKSGLQFHHSVMHKGTKFECDTCGKVWGRKSHLSRHIASVHEQKRPYECIVCGDKFSVRSGLKTHTAARHNRKMLQCDTCDASFVCKFDVAKHIGSVHLKLRLFSCVMCRCKFSRNSTLNAHIRSVHKKVVVTCDICSKSFTTKTFLPKHFAGHSYC